MKKSILCLFLICGVLLSGISVNANELSNVDEPTTILELLQRNRAERADVYLESVEFSQNMAGININEPIVVVYMAYIWHKTDGRPPEEIVKYIEDNRHISFALLLETPVVLALNRDRTEVSVVPSGFNYGHKFLEEIRTGMVQQTFLGNECNILDVYVIYIDGCGATIVYETDNGNYVRFYESYKVLQPLELSWEDYSKYSYAWYLQTRKLDTTEGGGSGSFVEFVEECRAQEEAQRQAELAAQTRKWMLISVTGVVVLGAATAAILLLRRKRRNATAQ